MERLTQDGASKQRTFMGHPFGLLNLFSTEFCERFSYYGMRAILIYFIYTGVSGGGLGLSEQDALYAMTLFGASVYLLSVIGGWMADRLIGAYRSVFYGGIIIAVGHIILGLPAGGVSGTFIALSCIALGTGLLKPNVSQMVGSLYREGDRRRQAGFSIFVMGINLGSFLSPLIVGTVAETYTFHTAFIIPAVFMIIALVVFRGLSSRTLKDVPRVAPNPLTPAEAKRMGIITLVVLVAAAAVVVLMVSANLFSLESFSIILPVVSLLIVAVLFAQMFRDNSLTKVDTQRLGAYIAVFVAATVFWAIEELQASVFALLADQRADNAIGDLTVPAAWYQSVNPLVIIILAPILALLWTRWKKQPAFFVKICIGLLLTAVSFAVPAIGFMGASDGKVSPLLLIVPIILFSVGELFVSPIGLSVTTELAPKNYQSRMMSIWFLANTLGQGINAYCMRFFDSANPSGFFVGYAIAVVVIVVLIFVLIKPLNRLANGVV